jgi:hypothetical protein
MNALREIDAAELERVEGGVLIIIVGLALLLAGCAPTCAHGQAGNKNPNYPPTGSSGSSGDGGG